MALRSLHAAPYIEKLRCGGSPLQRNDGGTVNIRINDIKISSGLRKFGAILGENCQLGCNSVTNPGTILGVGCSVLPNVTVTGCHEKNSQLR